MDARKMVARTAVVAVLAGAALVSSNGFANAINRDFCNTQNVTVYSPRSTCWANAGTIRVDLYSVDAVKGGINYGYIQSVSGTRFYYDTGSIGINPTQHITYVHID